MRHYFLRLFLANSNDTSGRPNLGIVGPFVQKTLNQGLPIGLVKTLKLCYRLKIICLHPSYSLSFPDDQTHITLWSLPTMMPVSTPSCFTGPSPHKPFVQLIITSWCSFSENLTYINNWYKTHTHLNLIIWGIIRAFIIK